jgi:hypothetical protein
MPWLVALLVSLLATSTVAQQTPNAAPPPREAELAGVRSRCAPSSRPRRPAAGQP